MCISHKLTHLDCYSMAFTLLVILTKLKGRLRKFIFDSNTLKRVLHIFFIEEMIFLSIKNWENIEYFPHLCLMDMLKFFDDFILKFFFSNAIFYNLT